MLQRTALAVRQRRDYERGVGGDGRSGDGFGRVRATRGHEKAAKAAAELDKLIARCRGVGKGAVGGLAFQPSLSAGMGDTIAQLLAAMSMGSGMGGYGMMGLYGGLPEMYGGKEGQADSFQGGDLAQGAGREGKPHGENPDEAQAGDIFVHGAASGAAEAPVPVRYRRQVGQYFQRVAEETGEVGQ